MRNQYERLIVALTRWGRAKEAGDSDELGAAEDDLMQAYRELSGGRR